MTDDVPSLDLAELLVAAEDVSPASAVTAAADHLRARLDAEGVCYWIADAAGRRLLSAPGRDRLPITGSAAGTAWLEQRLVDDERDWWVPVTVRGDAHGVLQVTFPDGGDLTEDRGRIAALLEGVGHALGYLLVANQLHTDAYEEARRSEPFALSMEVQRRLLPQAWVCEGGSFTLAGWLEPSSKAGGDTFDYIASHDRLTVTLTDAVGHDVEAALLATLAVNALRGARRAGGDVTAQGHAVHEAFARHASPEQYATGLLLELPLDSTSAPEHGTARDGRVAARVVNAGHPPMRLMRGGEVRSVELPADLPFGLDLPGVAHRFAAHEVELQPGDRLVLLTDGMYEGSADDFDLDAALLKAADLHPRTAVQEVAHAFRDHVGDPDDDATMLVLDWHGGTTRRQTSGGADH
ncbi:SpoIIE family protein phosphatase [Nocardioides perillae]|uniref:Serine phosphatase RsbU (Regulator of sigma subunit) n=1 Tax=Nocardioides perillae TaxID=1119534 RepID=A0A7Y9UKK0_9ACTN|nr:serine phosphatase RsbU (regulator of sigma subunit) [Nocardioides perillae]